MILTIELNPREVNPLHLLLRLPETIYHPADTSKVVGAVSIPSPISVFLLMGKTGAGKSSFIKLLGGKDLRGQAPEVSDGLESCEPRYLLSSWYTFV